MKCIRIKGICLILISLLISCNNYDKNKDESKTEDKNVIVNELKNDALKSKSLYNSLYKKSVELYAYDTTLTKKSDFLNLKILNADKLIDSLVSVLHIFSVENNEHIDKVADLLAFGKEGDSLFVCLNDVYNSTSGLLFNLKQKQTVDSMANNILKSVDGTKNWQQELFSMTTAQSATWILLALKKEIFEIGVHVFTK